MRKNELIITLVAGVIAVGLAVFLGIIVHRNITPDITGTYSGTIRSEDGILYHDIYILDSDSNVSVNRRFVENEGAAPIEISACGTWKEKTGYFLIKIKSRSAAYESEEQPLDPKGKVISPKKLLNRAIRVPKKKVAASGITLEVKQKDNAGNKQPKEYSFRRGLSDASPESDSDI